MRYLVVHSSDSVVEIIERFTPKTRISRKFVRHGLNWKFKWVSNRLHQRGYEQAYFWYANTNFIVEFQFRNERIGPIKNWIAWKIQVLLPDYTLYRAVLPKEISSKNMGAELRQICFNKVRFEFEEDHIRSFLHDTCNKRGSNEIKQSSWKAKQNSFQFWTNMNDYPF